MICLESEVSISAVILPNKFHTELSSHGRQIRLGCCHGMAVHELESRSRTLDSWSKVESRRSSVCHSFCRSVGKKGALKERHNDCVNYPDLFDVSLNKSTNGLEMPQRPTSS
jgi:hypothetical protein